MLSLNLCFNILTEEERNVYYGESCRVVPHQRTTKGE